MTKSNDPNRTMLPAPQNDADSLAYDFQRHFNYSLGRDSYQHSVRYQHLALAMTLRDRLNAGANNTRHSYEQHNSRRVCYLSMEYLLGRSLRNAAQNLDIEVEMLNALDGLGLDAEEISTQEHDAGLGNGGLGRLAACFLDSCATLGLPVIGYGIRYQYGMFRQKISNGFQIEEPDPWLLHGHPWEIERAEFIQRVKFGGEVVHEHDEHGITAAKWINTHDVLAIPYDVAVPGYANGTVNTLRLWSAAATQQFDLDEFNAGSYTEAVASRTHAENITMVLYPNDANENGKELRLRQQYFLASASLLDVIRQWLGRHGENFRDFADKHCFQLNDTHPTIAVAELMRLLMDEHDLEWVEAWNITRNTMAYTNHTLLPEALECWPVELMGRLLPRILEIIQEINRQFIEQLAAHWPGDHERHERLAIISGGDHPVVRMAHLAIAGSYSVNGVAELHSTLLKRGLFSDFHDLWPDKINNKTNGITQRRWLKSCNPALAALITGKIGDRWITDLDELRNLHSYAEDPEFRAQWRAVRQTNKQRVIDFVQQECGLALNPTFLFDVQVKRIHEYKRQLLNALHAVHLHLRMQRGDTTGWAPRAIIIGGKAAPGYAMAKSIIKFINNVAAVINDDPRTDGLLQMVFLPNYRITAMEALCPGSDLSAQLSTAGKEASGTGNMKFMLNGALTIGTLDGANIEIREAVGEDNFFLFGLTAEEVAETRTDYRPDEIVASDDNLRAVIESIRDNAYSADEPGIFDDILNAMLSPDDQWMTVADFDSFVRAQEAVSAAYCDSENWTAMSIRNCAASGRFSSDRTIKQYNDDIWHLSPVQVSHQHA